MIIGLSKPLGRYRSESFGSDSDNDTDAKMCIELTLEERLNRVITKEVNSTITHPTRTKNDITKVIKKELAIFEMEGNRAKNLEACYQNLQSIPPTSVEAEHAFSSAGIICTRIRSSLNDESLDILCFLRSHFKSEEAIKQ